LNTRKALARAREREDVENPRESHDVPDFSGMQSFERGASRDGSAIAGWCVRCQGLQYDLATVVYELGGGHCLTALQNSPFAFPSRNVLFERRQEYELNITIGKPRISDLLDNIEIMFKDIRPSLEGTKLTS
jgi:hypothetical protein